MKRKGRVEGKGREGEGGEGRGPHKCWNLGPQLPCYATGHVVSGALLQTLTFYP